MATTLRAFPLPDEVIEFSACTLAHVRAVKASARIAGDAETLDACSVALGECEPFPEASSTAIRTQHAAMMRCHDLVNQEIRRRRGKFGRLLDGRDTHAVDAVAVILPPPPPEWDRRITVGACSRGGGPVETIAQLSVPSERLEMSVEGYDYVRALDALEGLLLEQVAECRRLRAECLHG